MSGRKQGAICLVRATSLGNIGLFSAFRLRAYPDIGHHEMRRRAGLTLTHISAIIETCHAASIKENTENVAKYADMLSAMGTEPRLRIMRLLLSAHPDGMVVGEIQSDLDIPNSTLSHHLEKLKNEGLVNVRRESTFLRYTANTEGLQELLQFLYAECCTRNKAVKPQDIVQLCK